VKKQLFWIAILILGLCTSAAFAQNTIKIGLMAPLTGQYASEGQEMKQVVDLLAANVNAKGGVLGKKIDLITQDDGSDPRTAALAAQKLVSQGVVAVIGTYGSSVTEPTQNIFNESGIVQIANGATAIRLTEKNLKAFFRTCPRDDAQAEVVAAALKKYGFKKIAILHDNSTYAKDLADETNKLLGKEAGVKVVFFDALTPKQQDYSTILTKLKQASPDVVLYTGYYPEAGLLLRQKKEMGWNVPFMGGDATGNPDLVKIAGTDGAAGFYFVNAPLPIDVPEAKGFVNEFKAKYGAPPASIYSVLAGDGFQVIVAGLNGTKGNAKQLAEYLHTKKDFPGLTGKISFNPKGDRMGAVYRVYKVDAKGNFIIQP
jgi:branched-chain amino acid transport system substrate-binding protein